MTIDISQNSLKHDCDQLDFFPSLPTTNTFDAHDFKIMQKIKQNMILARQTNLIL